jgi:hypothetical protein
MLRCDVSARIGHAWNLLSLCDEHPAPDDERPPMRGKRTDR